ncbi:hypothetical protein [Shewanella sp. UCD-KL21]|uniref:hypothetical protein n=1 Tax=Shewanella sp. UCD-KL21 TaxID=1917164 RepID=UPI0009704AD9|nr:hypothetical protein [Shewanella sp. UCD-KL21]
MKSIAPLLALIPLLALMSGHVTAQEKRQMRKPPQEAYTICENKNAEDQVSFTTPKGDEIEATCILIDEELVAVPNNHTPPQQKQKRGQ